MVGGRGLRMDETSASEGLLQDPTANTMTASHVMVVCAKTTCGHATVDCYVCTWSLRVAGWDELSVAICVYLPIHVLTASVHHLWAPRQPTEAPVSRGQDG